jgi:L-iditol 2-dehydrogenase
VNLLSRLSLGEAEAVAIFGAGPAGVLAAQLARLLGARRVVVVEPDSRRRQAAAAVSDWQIGFDDQTAARLMRLTGGRGVDVAIPCCPGNAAFEVALAALAKRGRLGFFSGLTDEHGISNSNLNDIHYRELAVVGSYGCSIAHNVQALGLLAAGDVTAEGLPQRDISWDELSQALRDMQPTAHTFSFFAP